MKKLIAGNWKMNGLGADANSLISSITQGISANPAYLDACDFLVCPPCLHIPAVVAAAQNVAVGGQDCSPHEKGAYTSEISAPMLKDAGCTYVILGHSERRQYHGETDVLIAEKAAAANAEGLITIICVGETQEERDAGRQDEIVSAQLKAAIPPSANAENTVIAYEPVWAIGTGKVATPDDVDAMHNFIRAELQLLIGNADNVRILYGGSVKPDNAEGLFSLANVNGALIGGASLKADQFLGIAAAAKPAGCSHACKCA